MNKLLALALVSLSFSSLAKLPDPLWTPMGNNYQQQFGRPISHMTNPHPAITGNTRKPANSAHLHAPAGHPNGDYSIHHIL